MTGRNHSSAATPKPVSTTASPRHCATAPEITRAASTNSATPAKAEAVASGRSLRNLVLSLQALRGFALALSPDLPQSTAAFDRAIAQAGALDDPAFAGVADPSGHLKVEILQQTLRSLRQAVLAELGARLGVTVGFNSADGD